MALESGESISSESFKYPDIPEYSLKELLMLEKESSGMYFSGHLIDNYSDNLNALKVDRIADIYDDLDEESSNPNPKYRDKSLVNVAGIITAKKTKETRNGETMAFITLEDRYGEIEVIIFAKNYRTVSDIVFVDNAVYVTGSISVEDDDHVRILLSDMKPLKQNGEYQSTPVIETREAENPKRIFIKVPLISERHVTVLERISHFNPGEYQVVLFDSSSRKYSSIKNVRVANTEKVMEKLSDSFGQENIVISK